MPVAFDREGRPGMELVLTSRRALFPKRKRFAVVDDVETVEVPVSSIREVSWRRPTGLHRWGVAALLFLGGQGRSPLGAGAGELVIGFPATKALVAPVVPLLARRERVLRSRAEAAESSWTSPATFGRKAADKLAGLEAALRSWLQAVGPHLDEGS